MASKLRFPFVMTVSAVSLAGVACGSEVTVFSGSANASSADSGTGATTSTGTSTSTTSATSSSTGGINCPDTLPGTYDACTVGPNDVCTYEVACQSGVETISVTCDGGGWTTAGGDCSEYPGNSCPETGIHCFDGTWTRPLDSNPPSPCPSMPPPEGEACFTGGMGGVWQECGYRCEKDGWTIAECVMGSDSQWVYGDCNE